MTFITKINKQHNFTKIFPKNKLVILDKFCFKKVIFILASDLINYELKKLLRVCEANFGPLFGEMSREREGPTLSD